jgi:hypothetical protein
MSKKACGQHTDLASNDAVKVTRCTCGTVHITIHATGVTMRLAPEVFRTFAAGLRAAEVRFTEAADTEISSTGSQSIN